jgi:uncharacterized SAM-binding protein YcdF (DUF218 family)
MFTRELGFWKMENAASSYLVAYWTRQREVATFLDMVLTEFAERMRVNRRPVIWGVGVLVLCVAVGLAAFFQVGYFLEAPAQEPMKADLIVPLGGGSSRRVHKAAELYERGFAPNVLLTDIGDGDANASSHFSDWRIIFLLEHGVPNNMLLFDTHSTNSWEEAVNTLRLMREKNWQRVLVVSDPPHLRRLAWVWGKVFEGSGKEYQLIAAPLEHWDPGQWWQNENSARYVVMEVTKLAYYRLAH